MLWDEPWIELLLESADQLRHSSDEEPDEEPDEWDEANAKEIESSSELKNFLKKS
ncbi:hypothetical protein QYZ87_04730 [Porphyromonadaceae bacterium W3.11]|nr:hypothetical protein [Porphyromonadaceae bacterium W3.11]